MLRFFPAQAGKKAAPNRTLEVQVVTNKSKCLKETGNNHNDISQHKKSDE
jgi:hypothetical protein